MDAENFTTGWTEAEQSRAAEIATRYPVARTLGPTMQRPLRELHAALCTAAQELGPDELVGYVARDPDLRRGWPGADPDGNGTFHRPWRIHLELLRVLGFTMATPTRIPETDLVWIRALRRAEGTSGPVTRPPEDIEGRYGTDSDYRAFDRLEEPEVLDDYLYLAERIALQPGETLLALGVNDGRELEVFGDVDGAKLIGIDQSESAIAAARERFPGGEFHADDIGEFEKHVTDPVDVAIVLNTLQCRTVDRDAVLAAIGRVTHDRSRILISIPNCHRGVDDILRRPHDRRDRRHDRSLVFKDARYFSRHLYRSGRRRIEVFGTYDVFVLAVPEEGV